MEKKEKEQHAAVFIKKNNDYYKSHNDAMLGWFSAYNELIDNSIDAKASLIEFGYQDDCVVITDNGTGIKNTAEDVSKVLSENNSVNKGIADKIGEFGIGLKDAAKRIGDYIIIRSRAKGCDPVHIEIDWKTFDYSNPIDWRTLDIEDYPDYGTTIWMFFDKEDARKPHKPNPQSFCYYDKIIKLTDLTIINNGETYFPAKEIIFENEALILNDNKINGKSFDMIIGELKMEDRERSGFYITLDENKRYIRREVTKLCKGVEVKDGLYVEINLKGNWRLDKNKRTIMDIEIVGEFLMQPKYLPKWKQKMKNNKPMEFIGKLQNTINNIFTLSDIVGKAKRPGGGGPGGTKPPAGGIRIVNEADKIEKDKTKYVRSRDGGAPGLLVEYGKLSPMKYMTMERNSLGQYIATLNSNNETIKAMAESKNEMILLHFIFRSVKAYDIKENDILYKNASDIINKEHSTFQNI